MTMVIKDGERITAVEVKVEDLVKKVETMDHKLDQLLDLKSKGMGAFWLASLILGTGIMGMFASLITWFKGG